MGSTCVIQIYMCVLFLRVSSSDLKVAHLIHIKPRGLVTELFVPFSFMDSLMGAFPMPYSLACGSALVRFFADGP